MATHNPSPRCNADCLMLLGRVAPRCLVSSLLALERNGLVLDPRIPFSEARRRSCPNPLNAPKVKDDYPCPDPKLEAFFWKKMKRRLARLKRAFVNSSEADRTQAGFLLAAHLALIFIPAAGCFASRSVALAEATAFLDLITANEADSRCAVGSLAHLAAPVLWSLIFVHAGAEGDEP